MPCCVMQPHIMMEPPPCFTVCLMCLSCWLSAPLDQHQERPSEQKRLIFVSSDKMTCSQSATVQSLYFLANASLAATFLADSLGFLTFSAELIPASLSALDTVVLLALIPRSFCSSLAAALPLWVGTRYGSSGTANFPKRGVSRLPAHLSFPPKEQAEH